ncbi:TraR/DksA C4-type zinc finger protein [Aggregatibacter actinomycetemcomitans]|uniref:TraR/DksA C4-type zinc finger protein n=1 Tax=Aggregatibacter actinomycetemcomitans TaxID=714 RepID=UPI00023FEC07|nr:TraR/DksA C4-type zinc finger protein [Aggregatibacter actinomycetemcomitans]EHK89831.1 hypothetical protein RHAA1_10856 [Aggregatibacter actinomycetemcomitans RhAA1]KNE76926.1 hypothetical protein RHAA2_11165 [Aggregatibacter actinomycetemcomitans RhAA1]
MNDIADKAQQREEKMWDNRRKQQATAQQFAHNINTARYCMDCGVLIHPSRVKAMPQCVRCISCQKLHEESQK